MARQSPASSRRASVEKAAVHENDVVQLVRDLPDHGLARGATGTIVHVFDRPNRAYQVEFCDATGRTIAQLALEPHEIERPPRTIADLSRRTRRTKRTIRAVTPC